jgi:SAM-dependent methyltransferase
MNTNTSQNIMIHWIEDQSEHQALWHSESHAKPPKKVKIAADELKADNAYSLASEGTAILWRGDFQNARQLIQAMARRADRNTRKTSTVPSDSFHLHRQSQSQRARTLGMILIPLNSDYSIPLRRSPDVRLALTEVYGISTEDSVISLRELLGIIGAHEWRKKGVQIPQLQNQIHPHYGVFSPVRGEYLELIGSTPLPTQELAFDIGTGTGVIAILLAQRGLKKVIATDIDPRAIECAKENISRFGYEKNIDLITTNMFPNLKSPFIVCNPPWLPARPSSSIENAIYDPESQMLKSFLKNLNLHLEPKGEAWLILSNLAEHLGLRTREELLNLIHIAELKIIERIDIKPKHAKVFDVLDPLHLARSNEVTSLWRLRHA